MQIHSFSAIFTIRLVSTQWVRMIVVVFNNANIKRTQVRSRAIHVSESGDVWNLDVMKRSLNSQTRRDATLNRWKVSMEVATINEIPFWFHIRVLWETSISLELHSTELVTHFWQLPTWLELYKICIHCLKWTHFWIFLNTG